MGEKGDVEVMEVMAEEEAPALCIVMEATVQMAEKQGRAVMVAMAGFSPLQFQDLKHLKISSLHRRSL